MKAPSRTPPDLKPGFEYEHEIELRLITAIEFQTSDVSRDFEFGVASVLQRLFTLTVLRIRIFTFLLICRWIIQKAFYYPKTVGRCSFSGISCSDLFLYWPTLSKPKVQEMNRSVALTLDDLDDVTPTYIGCMTVNRWLRTPSPRETHYEVLTMSPHGIERLDRAPEDEEFHGKLMPMDVYLSEAAAISAAALDHDSGRLVGDEEHFRDLKAMLGISLGSSVVVDRRHEAKRHLCVQVIREEKLLLHYFGYLSVCSRFYLRPCNIRLYPGGETPSRVVVVSLRGINQGFWS